jgi:hypothetical protein
MAKYVSLSIDQGSPFTLQIPLLDAAGQPISASGLSFVAEMRRSYTSTTKYDFVVAVVNTGSSGVISISMTSAYTAAIKAGQYVFDVESITGSMPVVRTRVLEGHVTVTPSLIQSATQASVTIPVTNVDDSNIRYKAGKGIQFYNPSTGLWHTKLVIGNPPADAWDAGEV